jgi:sucrose-6F-phosphate phosphohydrolase
MNKPYALISDVDDTLLGNDDALLEFVRYHRRRAGEFALVYASGRMVESLERTIKATHLPQPEAIIAGVGSEIRRFPGLDPIPGWRERVPEGWSAGRVRRILAGEPDLTDQPDDVQSSYKVSYFLEDATPERLHALTERLRNEGIEADAIYSSRRDLDFLPGGLNKGTAAAHLTRYWQVPPDRVMVAGNSGNDADLFQQGFLGIVVGNADQELKRLAGPRVYLARERHARGVLAGVKHWSNRFRGDLA